MSRQNTLLRLVSVLMVLLGLFGLALSIIWRFAGPSLIQMAGPALYGGSFTFGYLIFRIFTFFMAAPVAAIIEIGVGLVGLLFNSRPLILLTGIIYVGLIVLGIFLTPGGLAAFASIPILQLIISLAFRFVLPFLYLLGALMS